MLATLRACAVAIVRARASARSRDGICVHRCRESSPPAIQPAMEATCAEKYPNQWEVFQRVAHGASTIQWPDAASMVVMLAGVDVAKDSDLVETVYGSLAAEKASQMTFESFIEV